MKSRLFLMVMGLVLVLFCYSSAQVPQMINYQGKLATNTGAPVNDTLQIVFTIYADEAGTTALWTETQPTVEILKGVFNVILGSVNPISYSVFDGSIRYLGVKVGGDPEITPRKPMVSVAYAYKSFEADTADYARVSMPDADWTIVGDNIYHLNGRVGIGTTSPNEQLEITGNLRLPVTTSTAGIITVGPDIFIHNYGVGNTFVGRYAGNLTMTGYANTGNGYGALRHNTTGYQNTANGLQSLYANTEGADNMANGYQALYSNTTGYNNTANGTMALYSNTTGYANIANGCYALYSNTTGSGNIANGDRALNHNTTGYQNTANGIEALYYNTQGFYNTADGFQALYANTSSHNTAIGAAALLCNTTGYDNTACGFNALGSNRTGYCNTANGYMALFSDTTGYFNTANGYSALYSNITGYSNTALGYAADVSSGDLHNSTAIGYGAQVDASNKVRIGNTSVTSIGGQVGWTNFSDGRYKKNVSQNVPGLAFISRLKPVTFTMDVDAIDAVLNPPHQLREGRSPEDLSPSAEEIASRQARSQIVYTGFIAQEVEQAAQEVGYDFSGVDAPKNDKDMYGLRYAEFVVPLVKAVQEQQQLIQEQQQMIQELQKRIEELEKR